MALSRDIVIRLLGDADSAVKAQKAAADAAEVSVGAYRRAEREYAKAQQAMDTAARKQREAMESVGRGSMVAGAAVVAGLGMATKAAMNWESAWTGVLKTVNGSPAQLAKLESGLRGLTRTLPATHAEIAAVAEAAGQLGVQTGSILDFTKVMVDLGETTNLSADEAATSIAQMMNVMQTAPGDVDKLGATLVALGNAGASTEADIMSMAQRLAGAGQMVGASEADVLGLANAMSSMGIEAELGGGAMSRTMLKIYSAVKEGGAALGGFAEVAGMSAQEFAQAFESDPMRAVDAFVQGLNRVDESGENVVAALDDLGIAGTQDLQVLLRLKGAGDLLTDSLETGSAAWKANVALIEEAAKRYDTTAAKTEMARNAINDAAIEIGDVFLPVMASLAESVADVATWFAELPDPVKNALAGLSGVAGVGMLAGGAFLLLAPRVMETYKAFQLLNTVHPGVASGLGAVGRAAGIVGVLFAVTAAVDGLVDSLGPAAPTMEETTDALLDLGKGMERINSAFAGGTADLFGDDIRGLADAARELTDPGLMDRFNDFNAELASLGSDEGRAARDNAITQLDQLGQSLALMVQGGNAELAEQQFRLLAEEWKRGGGTVAELRDLMPAYAEALKGVENEQSLAAESAKIQAENSKILAQDLDVAYGSLTGYAAALGMSEEATAELIEKSNELGESLGAFVDPLGAYTGLLEEKRLADEETARATAEATESQEDSWEDYVTAVDVTLDEYLARLEQQLADQDAWQVNMLTLAGRVSQGTIDELARMGPEGAPLVADLVNASDAELARFDDVTRARSKEATDAWGAQLTMASPVLAQIGKTAGAGVVSELAAQLAAGTTTVAKIAAQYGIELAGGINPILAALGKPIAGVGGRRGGFVQADGGVVSYYANGGMESHVAQIAPAGAWRVWAEPETGGEAYIPLSSSKRARSLDIWRETGRRLGAGAEMYAFGGINDVPRPRSTAPYGPPISSGGDAAMERGYADTVEWLKANLAPPAAALTGPGRYTEMFAAVKRQFPGARLHSGFRPGSITATGNLSYHALGRAIDITPDMGMFNWIAQNYPGSRELIFSPANGRQRWNGRPHMYSEPTRGDHWDHIHWAMARGGILNPHIRDNGGPLLPGYTYNGLGRPEHVMPSMPVGSSSARGGASQVVVNISGATITGTLRVLPDGTAEMADGRIVEAFTSAMQRGEYNP